MSKIDRAKKRRAIKQSMPLPELKKAAPRKRRGSARQKEINADAARPALEARCRRMGKETTMKDRMSVTGPHLCCQIGYVLEAEADSPQQVHDLWQTFARWCSVEAQYRRRYLGQSESAKGSSLVMVHERLETDVSYSIDLRDDDEKDRDAVNNWMRWQGYLGCLSPAQRMSLQHARLEDPTRDLWREGRATVRGRNSLGSLKALHEVVGRNVGMNL